MPSTSTPLPSAAQARADLRRELGRAVRIIGGILVVLWLVLVADFISGHRIAENGIVPRTTAGLRGILFAPFLHGGVVHLLLNSIGIVVMGGLVLFREERYFWTVTVLGALVCGIGTWVIGSYGNHIGASGVVFAYFGYLLLAGVFERRLFSIILSSIVAFVWGSFLLGMLPGQPGISWEGHLFGFIGGVLSAWLLARRARGA